MTLTLSLRPDVTVVAVPLPNEYNRFDAEMFWENDCMSFVNAKIPLPPGQYEIVGLLRDFKDAEELAVLNVAMRANGGDPELNWLLLKKIQ